MSAMEIDWGEWEDVIDELSRRYEGWTAIVEKVGDRAPERGGNGVSAYVASTLDHVSADLGGGEDKLIFAFDDAPPLVIAHPTGLALEHSEEGGDDILEIESDAGTTRVRLQVPVEVGAHDGA